MDDYDDADSWMDSTLFFLPNDGDDDHIHDDHEEEKQGVHDELMMVMMRKLERISPLSFLQQMAR